MGFLRRWLFVGLILCCWLLQVAVALECVPPTPTSSSLTVSSCNISNADLVVDISQLGVGVIGSHRLISVTNIDLAGHSLILVGWLASNPIDIAAVDGYAMTITLSGIIGFGRLIISGNFPNMTKLTLSASIVSLNSLVNSSVVDEAYGCSTPTTISSAMCVAAPSLTYSIVVGTYVTLSNTWDPVNAGSAYTGRVSVASSLSLNFGEVGMSGSFTVTGTSMTTVVASGDVALGAAGVFLLVQSNRIHAALFKFASSSVSVEASSTATVFVQGIAWSSSSSASGVSIGGGSGMTFDALTISVASSRTDTAGGTLASSRAVGIGTVNATGLLFQRGATMMLSNCDVIILGSDGANAYGVLFAHDVTIVRESVVSISNSRWAIATHGVGNASMMVLRIVGAFPSLVVVFNNTVNVSCYALSPVPSSLSLFPGAIPSLAQFTAALNVDSQVIFHDNRVVLYSVDPDLPTGIVVLRMNMDGIGTGAATTSSTAPAEGTTTLRGGTLAITNSRFDFNGSQVNGTVIDGTAVDLIDIYAGGVLRYTGVNLTSVNVSSAVFLSIMDLSVNKVVAQRNQPRGYTFVTGCFGVQDDFPVISQAPLYMSFDTLDEMTNFIPCACTSVLNAFGQTASVGGTYPNCYANCTQQSTAPFSWARELCASPYVVTASVTITTKTVPPQPTITTVTDLISPSRASVTMSPTAPRTQSPTLLPEPTVTRAPTSSLTDTDNATTGTEQGNVTHSAHHWSPTPAKNTKTQTFELSPSASPLASYSVHAIKTLSWRVTPTAHTLTPSRTVPPTGTPQLSVSPSKSKVTVVPSASQRASVSKSAVMTPSRALTATKHLVSRTSSPTHPPMTPSMSGSVLAATATLPHSRRTILLTLSESVRNVTISSSTTPVVTPTRRPVSITSSFVVPPAPFLFVTESQVLGFITLAVTTISSIVTGYPTVLHAQFIAVVGQSQAAGENAHQRTDPMAQIVSPLWSLGSTAVAAGNIVIIAVVIVVHAVVTKLGVLGGAGGEGGSSSAASPGQQKPSSGGKGVELPDSWVIHRFPELSYVIVLTFYQGLVNAAFRIFYHSDGPVFVIGTVCLLMTVALPLLLYYLLYRYLAGAWPPYRAVVFSHALGWAFPHGYWSAGRVKRCFGRIFASTTDKGVRFTGYPLLLVLLVNAASNVQAVDKQQRDAQFGVLGLLFVLAAIFVAVFRPHRSTVTNVVYVISFTMLMIFCVCLANEATNATAADGVPVIIVILEVLLWANGVYEIVVWFAEMRGVLHAARKAHMQGDESGTMRTRTAGARADAKKAAAARSAFAADDALVATTTQQESDHDGSDATPSAVPPREFSSSPASSFYVEMGSPPVKLNQQREDDMTMPVTQLQPFGSLYEPPAAHVPAPGRTTGPFIVEAPPTPAKPPTLSPQTKEAVAPPPPPAAQDDFLDLFASEAAAPATAKQPPSFGLLQRAQDESLASKGSKAAAGGTAKKPLAAPPSKSLSKKKQQNKKASRRRGGGSSSSSSSNDIFGSDTDDSDL
jgi:hypothetical protein